MYTLGTVGRRKPKFKFITREFLKKKIVRAILRDPIHSEQETRESFEHNQSFKLLK